MNKKLTTHVGKTVSANVFAAVTLAVGMLLCTPAQAFNLGNLTTLSILGEPLRLEYEVLDLTPAELESLQVTLASPDSYASRGLGYGSALEGMRLGLRRDASGKVLVRMEGQRAATEPFVDLLLNITWAAGSTTRSVSVMLSPATAYSSTSSTTSTTSTPPTSATPAGSVAPANVAAGAAPVSPSAQEPATSSAGTVLVQPGDTAGELALRERPPGVSQSQYLLALAQVNPSAFVEGNVNRLLAGATLSLPTEAQAQATPPTQARQIVAAQWEEFLAFRQQLATSRPGSAPDRPAAQAQGKLEGLRSGPNASTPIDKLTLSKPTASGAAAKSEQALLNERQAKDANARLQELSRNMSALNQLVAKAGSGDGPAITAALPAPPAAASLVDQLADHPAVLPVAGGLLGLALAWLGLRLRRKSATQAQTPATEAAQPIEPLGDAPVPHAEREPVQAEPGIKLDLALDLSDEPGRSDKPQARFKETSTS